MQLTHKITLCPTPEQADYFTRACGTARRVWNWALAEWNRQYKSGQKPHAMALKKQFNAIKYSDPQWLDKNGRPWLKTIHRDAHSRPFDPVRGKPRPSGRGRIARTAAPSYNGVAADNQGSLRQDMPEVTPVEIRAAVAHSAQEPTEATHSGSMLG